MPEQNQYDFIMNPQQAPKKRLLPGGGGSKTRRVVTVAAGGGLLLVILLIGFSLLFGGGGDNTEDLVAVAQQQTELIRISDQGLSRARGREAVNLAITTKYALTTEQQPLLKAIKGQGRKLGAQELGALKSSATDQKLTEADQNNKFDEVFIETLQTGIVKYQGSLKKAFDGTANRTIKQTLSGAYTNAKTLFPPKEDQSI